MGEVNIIWSFGKSNTPIRTSNNVAASSIKSLTVYSDSFTIPSLTVQDTDDSYHCQVLINSTTFKEDFTISLSSNDSTSFMYILCMCKHQLYSYTPNSQKCCAIVFPPYSIYSYTVTVV